MTYTSKFSANENSQMESVGYISITTISKNLKLKNGLTKMQTSGLNSLSMQQRISINELTTLRWSLEEDLNAYRSYDIPAIGVSWRKLLAYGVQRGVRKIKQSELPVSSLGWVGGFTGHNGFGFDEVLLECKRAIRVASQLGAPTVTVVTGPQNRHIDSHANRLVCLALQELAELAECYGVTISLQPMHPIYQHNWSMIHTTDQAIKMIRQIGHPSLKLALGTYHVGDESDLCTRVHEFIDLIGIVHLADRSTSPLNENDREIPGEGQLPLRGIIQALESAGYDGWYETEVWSKDLWKLDHHDLIQCCLQSQTALFSNEFSETVSEH